VLRVAAFDEGGGEAIQDVRISVVPALAGPCAGNCSGDRSVTIDELVTGVNITLGGIPMSRCPAGDTNGDGLMSIDELVRAVNSALSGCPA